jgi:hypothetical protein
MQNQHPDEGTLRLFNRICRDMNLDLALKEMYREYLIAGQVNTLSLFTRSRLNFVPSRHRPARPGPALDAARRRPPGREHPRPHERHLRHGRPGLRRDGRPAQGVAGQFFNPRTTPARKAAMQREQPVIAAVFTGRIETPYNDGDLFTQGKTLYTLNPRMVHRSTMPKGASPYPHPPMTANFALLEAKRLLNIMDYSLLQGGTNYIVVAKQGSDALPAQQPEIDNLTDQVRSASRTGVLVGDHRLSIEIITPKLDELLSTPKRKLIGRKLAMMILRVPEQVTPDPGNEGARGELELMGNTITSDRRDIKRHVERFIYDEIADRNSKAFPKGPPSLWHPKIVLSGVKDFFANVMSARDRGDIPRKWAVEVLGFDYEAGVAQRQRELDAGHDELMVPGSVPFSSGDGPPNDNPEGRPPGSSSNNGRPGGQTPPTDPAQRPRDRKLIPRRRGEPVRAQWDEQASRTVRVGELTMAMLEEYPEHTVGRVTEFERAAVNSNEPYQNGPVAVIPVNPAYAVREIRAFRLQEGLSMIVGQREDGALVARALCFREPQFDVQQAEEIALRWGFAAVVTEPEPEPEEAVQVVPPSPMDTIAAALAGVDKETVVAVAQAFGQAFASNIVVNLPAEGEKELIRDETGAIVRTRPVPPSS